MCSECHGINKYNDGKNHLLFHNKNTNDAVC